MIQQSTIQFLKDLKNHNNKEWFDKNRARYEAARADYLAFGDALIQVLAKTDSTIAHLSAKESLFRINRDVRFSKDKSPYKTNMGLYLSKGGKKGPFAGYYFHLEPGKSFIAGGLWMPSPADLKKVRQEIDYNWEPFRKIVEGKRFRDIFGGLDRSSEYVLSRPPKNYAADNPAIEYLKFKSFVATARIEDSLLTSKTLVSSVTTSFRALQPLINFCNEAIEEPE